MSLVLCDLLNRVLLLLLLLLLLGLLVSGVRVWLLLRFDDLSVVLSVYCFSCEEERVSDFDQIKHELRAKVEHEPDFICQCLSLDKVKRPKISANPMRTRKRFCGPHCVSEIHL